MERKIEWPGWDVIRVIGHGSFGTVYEIQREFFGKTEQAALKVIRIPQEPEEIQDLYREGFDSASITAHFKGQMEELVREYSLMSVLRGHTNVVYCDDLRCVQHDDGIGWDVYIKMELLTPLKSVVGPTYNEDAVIRLGMDLCRALMLCRRENIVHRDIKPENIFVSRNGDCKLGDFGVAKISEKTASGTKIGTYEYMAPEVYRGQAYGGSADLYSLGLVMYWMMNQKRSPFLYPAGNIPTTAEKEAARSRRFGGEPLPRPRNGSQRLWKIVEKACAWDPRQRYADPAEMLQQLWALNNGTVSVSGTGENTVVADAGDTTVGNGEVTWTGQSGGEKDRGKVWIIVMASLVVVFALVIGAFLISWLINREAGEAPAEPTEVLEILETEPVDMDEVHLLETLTFQRGGELRIYGDEQNRPVLREFYNAQGQCLYRFCGWYDEAGNLTVQTASDGADNLLGTTEVIWNEAGKPLQEVYKAEDGTVLRSTQYTYNDEGSLEKLEKFGKDGILLSRTEYRPLNRGLEEYTCYDRHGNQTETGQLSYREDGTLSYKMINRDDGESVSAWYNEQGSLIRYASYDPEGNLRSQQEGWSGENGLLEKRLSIYYYSGGENRETDVFEYESSGQILRLTTSSSYIEDRTTEYVRDLFGRSWCYWNGSNDTDWQVMYQNVSGELLRWDLYEGGRLVSYTENTYNADGWRISGKTYDEAGNLFETNQMVYDDRGNVLEETTRGADGSIKMKVCSTYEPDWPGPVLQEIYFYNDDGSYSYDRYDRYGTWLEWSMYEPDGSLRSKQVFLYNEQGLRYRQEEYRPQNGSLVLDSVTLNEYDESGNRIKSSSYDGDMVLQSYTEYQFDEEGRELSSYHYNASGKLMYWYSYTYDEYGMMDSQYHSAN